MKLYVWDGEITYAYGGYGYIVVAADSVEDARQLLHGLSQRKMADPEHCWQDDMCKDLCHNWTEHLHNAVGPAREHNDSIMEDMNEHIIAKSHNIEPRGGWEGSCYQLNWNKILSMQPQEVDIVTPAVVAYYYGYEG